MDHFVWSNYENKDRAKFWGTYWTIDSDALKASVRDAKQCDVWSWSLKIVLLKEMYVA